MNDYRILSQYMTQEECNSINKFINIIKDVVICKDGVVAKAYPNLLQLLILLTFDQECALCSPELADSFSIVCKQSWELICKVIADDNFHGNEKLDKCVYKSTGISCALKNIDDRLMFYALKSDDSSKILRVISEDFLRDVMSEIEKNDVDLFSLVKLLKQKYEIVDEIKADILAQIKEFQKLYNETPTQVLIRDQRYYQELGLAQAREQAELDRQMKIEQAEKDRKMQLKIHREQKRMQKEQWRREEEQENYRRQEERIAQHMAYSTEMKRSRQEKFQRDNQRRKMERERREAAYKAASDHSKAMHLCWKCANYCHGCRGGSLNCGNLRPKR